MRVSTFYLKHEGETKFYEIVTFEDDDREFFTSVRRWGKVGTLGRIKVEKWASAASMGSAVFDLLDKKERGGYQSFENDSAILGEFTDEDLYSKLRDHYGLDFTHRIASVVMENNIIANVAPVLSAASVMAEGASKYENWGEW
jgi:predicted DNA-binding WGR domain protein